MAKKKSNTDALDAVDIISVETVQDEQPSEDILVETAEAKEVPPVINPVHRAVPPVPRPLPKETVAPAAPTVPVKKKRIRIRKKGAKKLSAAIICQNPNIVRFI